MEQQLPTYLRHRRGTLYKYTPERAKNRFFTPLGPDKLPFNPIEKPKPAAVMPQVTESATVDLRDPGEESTLPPNLGRCTNEQLTGYLEERGLKFVDRRQAIRDLK